MEQLVAILVGALLWVWGYASHTYEPEPCPAPVITTPVTTGPEITTPPVSIPGPTIPEYAPPVEHPGVTIIETTDIPAATADRPYDPAIDNNRYTK